MNGNVKLGRAAARSGEWAQHFSNASCCSQSRLKIYLPATRCLQREELDLSYIQCRLESLFIFVLDVTGLFVSKRESAHLTGGRTKTQRTDKNQKYLPL